MKIGVLCYPTYGGSGVIATELGKALALRGHEIHFISYSQPVRLDMFSDNLRYHEVPVMDYPLFEYIPYETELTSKLVEVVRFEKLDLVHVHYAIPHASVAYMARQILISEGRYVPFVTTLHGTDITLVGRDASFIPVVTFAINESDAVTAVSQSLKDTTLHSFNIKKDIVVIPNFIDLKRFSKKPREHFRKAIAPLNERLICHTSNFRKVKRVQDVVKVFLKLQETIPSKLLLIGDGPERASIERECRECEVAENIRFLGKQDAIEEILSVCDLFILPSETESFGLAALEAMACQLPVISTESGGIPELNIHGVTGYNCRVGDIDDMVKHASMILSDENTFQNFRSNALEQAKKFDISIIAPMYEKMYQKVLELTINN